MQQWMPGLCYLGGAILLLVLAVKFLQLDHKAICRITVNYANGHHRTYFTPRSHLQGALRGIYFSDVDPPHRTVDERHRVTGVTFASLVQTSYPFSDLAEMQDSGRYATPVLAFDCETFVNWKLVLGQSSAPQPEPGAPQAA